MTKYRKGWPITSLDALAHQEFVYIRDKVYHNGWFKALQLRYLEDMVKKEQMFYAIKKKEVAADDT